MSRGAERRSNTANYHPCIYDRSGFCTFLQGECKRGQGQAMHPSGFYLKCAYASYHNGVLRCGIDGGETQKYVLAFLTQIQMKLAVDDLKSCSTKRCLKKGWANRNSAKKGTTTMNDKAKTEIGFGGRWKIRRGSLEILKNTSSSSPKKESMGCSSDRPGPCRGLRHGSGQGGSGKLICDLMEYDDSISSSRRIDWAQTD